MRNILISLVICLVSFATVSAQTKMAEVTPNGYITEPSFVYLWGTTSDTLTNADTLTSVIRVMGLESQDFNIQLYSDHVSGTAGGNVKAYRSIDGVNYTVLDTITVSSLTADALDSEVINLNDYMYPYLKIIYLQTGTAVTVPKLIIYTKID
jgi:hypothetical protein